MKENSSYFNKSESETPPLWKWKGIDFPSRKSDKKLYPLQEFFQEGFRKGDDVVLGPGLGVGIGCGAGLGMGLIGGAVFGGGPWNQLTPVFGIGIGCGVGVGFGFGQGFGGGFSLESFQSHHLFDPKPKSKKRILLQI